MKDTFVAHVKNTLEYPVGGNIDVANDFARKTASIFCRLFKKERFTGIEIFCRGSSGSTLASLFSIAVRSKLKDTKIYINYVRKENEVTHNSNTLKIQDNNRAVVFIDDFISSGRTLNAVYNSFYAANRNKKVDFLICERLSKDCFKSKIKFTASFYITTIKDETSI